MSSIETESHTIETKYGAYDNSAKITSSDGECDICGQPKRVLEIDTSWGEYATVQICTECFIKFNGE